MREDIQRAMFREDVLGRENLFLEQEGTSSHGAVSDLACEAVAAAVIATQRLYQDAYGQLPPAFIDRGLVDLWCMRSFVPEGWKLPSKWDAYSGDYWTTDGWIRLHCNAAHHRAAALRVLGEATSKTQLQSAILSWGAGKLEDAVVDTGGCAAKLRGTVQWRSHAQGKAVAAEPIIAWNRSDDAPTRWCPQSLKRPLQGLRVLDLTRIIAGPVATRFLASLGADILRIDPPGWTEGANEIEMTVGKTCAELDLKDESGRATFAELLRSAHVLVYGYRQDALQRLRFGSETLAELNPSLISVRLTAYGWTGPWSNRRGFDSLVQRSSGLAVESESRVIDLPYQVLDHATGYLMAGAVVEALRCQLVDNSVSHTRLSLARQAMMLLENGVEASAVPHEMTIDPEQYARQGGQKEKTSWGKGWRCPLPYQIEGNDLGWVKPAHELRSDLPEWSLSKEHT